MAASQIYKDIAQRLFDIFFVDDYKYGRQLENGSYYLIRERITPVTIEDMLINNKSLLTYQEFHTLDKAHIKWICIDLDISKNEIENNQVNEENLESVKVSADAICLYLASINIPYLLEFSGRRGFHIWVIFDELLTKKEGYYFISFILSKVKLENNIIADKFPAVSTISKNSKGVGKGVKLPLSLNKVSNSLSYFIDDNNPFDFNQENWLSRPNNEFITKQLSLLNNFRRTSKKVIQPFLDEFIEENKEFLHEPILKLKKVTDSFLSNEICLDDIILSLKKCTHLADLLKDYQKGLSGKERNILVGLLGNLKTKKDSNFGYNILLELFSNIKGFNREITIKKLEGIKYYSPISCSYWNKCDSCKESNCKITSPIQLIDGVTLEDIRPFSIKNIDNKLFNKIQKSLYKYSLINDETPLFPHLEKINHLSQTDIYNRIKDIYNGKINIGEESYKFIRNENTKIRELYNLNPKDNFISTYFLSVLHKLYYSEISNFSLGYQISPSFYNESIFANWFANWGLFSKNIEQVISNVEYDNHFLIKIDIKSFYDSIILQRLDIKLFEESPKRIKQKLDVLAKKDLNKYKNIVNYLILLTKKVTGNHKKGLPQGPAYARYLAELYLLGLDQVIEEYIGLNKGREFYNRFVDDVYIFLDSKERAIELNHSIIDWLTLNGLEINKEKSDVINVEIYRESGKFKKYKDNAKYTINKVNKNKHVIPNEDIQSALIQLENLTHDANFGLKDNLRFFFFQFKSDIRLKAIRRKLAKILPYSDNGRGTLYKIFYKDLLTILPEYFMEIIENTDKIKGLSLTHYLNTILFEWDNIENKETKITQLIENIFTKEGLSDADRLLILTISMKQNITISEDFLNKSSAVIKKSVIETPTIKYTINSYSLVEDNLRNISDSNLFLKELFRIISENEMTLEVAQRLADYSLTRFSIWSENEFSVLDIESNLISYYHCLCFFTLFDTSKEHQNVTRSWENLLKKSSKIEIDTPIEFKWLNKLENFNSKDFSRNSYSILLASTEGSLFNKYRCLNNFIEKYQGVVLLLLYSQNQDDFNDILPSITTSSDNLLFIQWLQNGNVSLYPKEHNKCIQNLALNGLIILQNNTENKIFIKSIGKVINPDKYKFIEASEVQNNEFEYSIKGYVPINSQLNKSDLVSFLESLVRQIEIDETFKNNYGNYPLFYNPALFKDGNPLVPFYSNFSKAVSKDGVIVDNNIELYWKNLLNIISDSEKSNIKISPKNNSYNYSLKELNDKFFPENIVKNVSDKIDF